jgi:hypothetical protein
MFTSRALHPCCLRYTNFCRIASVVEVSRAVCSRYHRSYYTIRFVATVNHSLEILRLIERSLYLTAQMNMD